MSTPIAANVAISAVVLGFIAASPADHRLPAKASGWGKQPVHPISGPLRWLRCCAIVAFTWPIEWTPGQVLSWLRGGENAHDQLGQRTEPERFVDKARVSLEVGSHAPLRYGAHDDAGDVAVRLGFAHCAEQPWTIKHRHHEVGDDQVRKRTLGQTLQTLASIGRHHDTETPVYKSHLQ